MTASPRSLSPYQARLQRAENLTADLPFAAEILKFYRHIASCQADVYSELARTANGVASVIDLSSRTTLDLTQILPHYRGFLSVAEKHGPGNLAAAARQIAGLGTDSWIALLESYWQIAGLSD